jgi:hypothetical protein
MRRIISKAAWEAEFLSTPVRRGVKRETQNDERVV